MWQQGQVFKLKAKGVDGQPLWAYRYRLEGRGSARPQVGGFAIRADAMKALQKVLARLGPQQRTKAMSPSLRAGRRLTRAGSGRSPYSVIASAAASVAAAANDARLMSRIVPTRRVEEPADVAAAGRRPAWQAPPRARTAL